MILGTAGHIDHGKSTLVTALTGIDPDRLAEEKRRGMTIDLGFAHMRLPSGRQIGIVDVPGHARFIRNMLAGAHGLDAALLVVASDEGVMPQTREHLEIIDLLDIRQGVIALTKVDLIEASWLELVESEVAETVKGTALEGMEVVGVSAVTGAGMDELIAALDRVFAKVAPKPDARRPRLPIDRVFTMSGFGTVVTGTLIDGSIAVGDELEVLPGGAIARVRGLQQHNVKVESAVPGSRVAANLIGVEKELLQRGHVLAPPDALQATRRIDGRVRVLASAPRGLRHGAELLLHTGTVEVGCRAILLEGDTIEPGAQGWIQLYLERPIAVANDDRFILRIPSPSLTVAGGQINDVAPRKHPRHDAAVRESLERRAAGDVLQEELRKYPRGVAASALLKATLANDADVSRLRAHRVGDWLFAEDAWSAIADRATRELTAYHAAHPLRRGMPREELRNKLAIQPHLFGAVVKALAEEGRLEDREGEIAAPSHKVAIESSDGPASSLLDLLGREPFAPPSLAEAMRTAGVSTEVVRAMAQRGDLVRVSDDVAFTRDAYERAVVVVRELIASSGSVSVAQVRDRLGASRRPVLALLEHLDAAKVTRRVGDAR
ncbi:MAG TPA: selenocysteine-specific translation elongation factor, partial [Candidatus Dormibacteraeota bacterium]|nr:selenocysteine-specific translation elongation factor [Candidatus Dormibacteraeota bacterium]